MPLPRWLARINRLTWNRRNVKKESWPLLTHVGRSSGKTYRTPLDAFPVDGGYVFIVNYGVDRSDWVQNILQAGQASLRREGEDIALVNPRVISIEEAVALAPDTVKPPPGFMNVTDCLRMDFQD